MNLHRLTCTAQQGQRLLELGINAVSAFSHTPAGIIQSGVWAEAPAYTKAELDSMIGPHFAKPDFWEEERRGGPKSATDPLSFPVFFPTSCIVFSNPAQASAAALIYLLENEFLSAYDANDRHYKIFYQDGPDQQTFEH